MMITNLNKKLIPIAIVAAGILIAGVFVYINQGDRGVLSSQEAAEKAIAFINQTIKEDVTASLVDVVEESGVYKIHLKIAGTEYDSYMTKDGKFLFASAFDLENQEQASSQKKSEEVK